MTVIAIPGGGGCGCCTIGDCALCGGPRVAVYEIVPFGLVAGTCTAFGVDFCAQDFVFSQDNSPLTVSGLCGWAGQLLGPTGFGLGYPCVASSVIHVSLSPNLGSTLWELIFSVTGGTQGATYNLAVGSFNCLGTNIMNLASSFGTNCVWPATVTITPG